jgi:hypothetical protein
MQNAVRVGIATQYVGNHNYGGQLQGFALQHTISHMGYDCRLISYKLDRLYYLFNAILHSSLEAKIQSFQRKSTKRQALRQSQLHKAMLDRKTAFQCFIDSVSHTKLYDSGNISDCNAEFDYFVTGSDQVWSPAGLNKFFLLDFVSDDKERIAYAASLGRTELTLTEKKRFQKSLTKYRAVSLREQSGVELIQPLVDPSMQVVHTLDPTLLLNKKMWNDALGLPEQRFLSEEYVFIYAVDGRNRSVQQAVRSCNKAGLNIVLVQYAPSVATEISTRYYGISVPEWVHAIRDAEAVITDSFHGTAFALNFSRPLWVIRKTSERNKNYDDRREGILKDLNVQGRLLSMEDEIEDVLETIDYRAPQKELALLRKRSLAFIRDSLM